MTDLLVQRDVPIALRDGTVTRADVWRAAEGAAGPAILVRTPYDKSWIEHQSPIAPGLAVDRGYAFVVQDARGRFASDGDFDPFRQERADGYDSVQWLAEQAWCDGDVVMSGWSYVGATQWLAAEAAPPALRAIAPMNSSPSYGEGWTFRNGVLERGLVGSWVAGAIGDAGRLVPDDVEATMFDDAALADLLGAAAIWLTRPIDDPYWSEVSVAGGGRGAKVPVLHVGGWYDVLNAATLAGHAARGDARDRLVVGGWAHDNLFGHLVADRNVGWAGSGPAFALGERMLDFFDAAIAGRPSELPPVSAFVLGARRWLELESWPPPGAAQERFAVGAGTFVVDPDDLPPALGGRGILVGIAGSGWGPRDQRPVAARPDVLCLPLAPVAAETLLAGPARAELLVAAEGGSPRQWTVVLCAEAPDGRLDVLTEGVADAPAVADTVAVPLGDVCVQLPAGARLVALVAGGSVPRWEPVGSGGRQHVREGSTVVLTVARL
jgi:hypothetical protein